MEQEEQDRAEVDGEVGDQPAAAKKRTHQERGEGVSEEELEAYKRSRLAADDPMAKYLGKDEAVY